MMKKDYTSLELSIELILNSITITKEHKLIWCLPCI